MYTCTPQNSYFNRFIAYVLCAKYVMSDLRSNVSCPTYIKKDNSLYNNVQTCTCISISVFIYENKFSD